MKYLTLLILCMLLACNTDTSKQEQSQATEEVQQVENTAGIMPPLPSDSIRWLAENATSILIDLYHYNSTISLKDGPAVANAAYFISPEGISVDISQCQPFASIVFTGDSGVLYATEIFMNGQCSFIRFRKHNKITHHNMITKRAFSFFSNVLKQLQPTADTVK